MVLSFNEERQIACEIGRLVGYSLKCLTHSSHNTMGSTAHFFCLRFPSQHSQTISILRPFSSCSSPLKEKSIWPKAAEIIKGPEKGKYWKAAALRKLQWGWSTEGLAAHHFSPATPVSEAILISAGSILGSQRPLDWAGSSQDGNLRLILPGSA